MYSKLFPSQIHFSIVIRVGWNRSFCEFQLGHRCVSFIWSRKQDFPFFLFLSIVTLKIAFTEGSLLTQKLSPFASNYIHIRRFLSRHNILGYRYCKCCFDLFLWSPITINVPLFKKLRDQKKFFCGTITFLAISRDILRGPRLFVIRLKNWSYFLFWLDPDPYHLSDGSGFSFHFYM